MADSAATSLTVGWIGTGRMGKPLAERLARAGVPLAVWNRTRGKAEAVARTGAELVNDPSDLAGRDVVFTMVTGSAELESVVTRLFADPGRAPGSSSTAPRSPRRRPAGYGWLPVTAARPSWPPR